MDVMHVTLLGENSVYVVYNSYDIGCIKVEDSEDVHGFYKTYS